MENILLVRTSSMGDLIHTWPALTDLARQRPGVRVSWLVEEAFTDIAALHPSIVQVLPIAWRRWRKHCLSAQTWREIGALRQQMRTGQFDLVLDSQGLLKSAIPARWAKAPVSGYDRSSIREPLASRFYQQVYTVSRQLSAVERNRLLFATVFDYSLSGPPDFGVTPPPAPASAPSSAYVVLLHATSRDSKLWPEADWVALARQLYRDYGWIAVLPWGNQREQTRAQNLAAQMPQAQVSPRLSLHDAAGLLGHAAAVVGVDTGLLHLANAFKVPLVGIYTDTDPMLTGVVVNQYARNLGGIGQVPSPAQVIETLQQLMVRDV